MNWEFKGYKKSAPDESNILNYSEKKLLKIVIREHKNVIKPNTFVHHKKCNYTWLTKERNFKILKC